MSETFFIARITERDIILSVHKSSLNISVILVTF